MIFTGFFRYVRVTHTRLFRAARSLAGISRIVSIVTALALVTVAGETPAPQPRSAQTSGVPSNLPDSAGHADSQSQSPKDRLPSNDPQIEIQSKFIEIPESVWGKLCTDDAVFNKLSASLPEAAVGKKTSAELIDEVTGLSFKHDDTEKPNPISVLKVVTAADLQDMIRSLSNMTGIKLLAAPSVTTSSGHVARIEINKKFRLPKAGRADQRSTSGETSTESVTNNTGMILDVAPNIKGDGSMDLKLDCKLMDVPKSVPSVEGIKKSAAAKNEESGFWDPRMVTVLTIWNHQTVVLGGLKRYKQDPGHGSITQNSIVLILVTPTVAATNAAQ